MSDDIPLTKDSVQVESKEVKENDWNEQTFFPFQEDHERQYGRIDHHAAAFPKLGIGALIGALALIALSGGILLIVQTKGKVVSDWNVHVYKTHRYVTIPKPAAWLSGILSGISVCFHIALSEGLNIAWWYHVRQENATIRDLHNIWEHGTSTWQVLTSGASDFKHGIASLSRKTIKPHAQDQPQNQKKRFSYVALATLFVATIPLNGFLLQNAVVVHTVTATNNANITVPMLNGADFGSEYAPVQAVADALSGGVSQWTPTLAQISQLISPKVQAVVDLGPYNTSCLDTCRAMIPGAGFSISCTEDRTQHYSILTDAELNQLHTTAKNWTAAEQEMDDKGTDVFSTAVTFNVQEPHRITVQTLYKDSSNCTGEYLSSTCQLDLATVQYPVIINAGVKETAKDGLNSTTLMTLDMDLMTESPEFRSTLPSAANIQLSCAGAGVAGLFGQLFNSTVNLRYYVAYAGPWILQADGLFGQQAYGSHSTFSSNAKLNTCTNTFNNMTQQVLATMQSVMFQLSTYEALAVYSSPDVEKQYATPVTPPHAIAVQNFQQNRYRVVWSWFFGAMAVTTVVAAFITPTFWGYWRLERKTTMSPFETARAFHAPMLYQEDSTIKSEDLIKRVGDIHIHRDLPVVAVLPPAGSWPGSQYSMRSTER